MKIIFITFLVWIVARGRLSVYAAFLNPAPEGDGGDKTAKGDIGIKLKGMDDFK